MEVNFFGVSDASPSDQLGSGEDVVHVLAIVLGRTTESVQLWTELALPQTSFQPFQLRKWSGSSQKYKRSFVKELPYVLDRNDLHLAVAFSKEKYIRSVGCKTWESKFGRFPTPNKNSKGKNRYQMDGFRIDDNLVEPFWITEDQIAVLGWYARCFCDLHKVLESTMNKSVCLNLLIDKLALDFNPYFVKGSLLKELIRHLSNGYVTLLGYPMSSDTFRRDLFVDNTAGLFRTLSEKFEPHPNNFFRWQKEID